MAIDPYALCPCGSGKKIKFCCNDIVEDMQKILSMRQNNQLHMALQSLSRLRKSLKAGHPGEVWVRTTEATILLEDNQLDLAKTAVAESLESLPDNPQLLALSAITSVLADGYQASQDIVNRALQQSAVEQRHLIANLASLLAQHFMEANKVMAARQHLTLSLRMSVDPAPVVEQLSAFDGNQSLPFWFRSDYFLKSVDVAEELKDEYQAAAALESCGCYQLAATAFEAIANKDPENSGLWYNTALCLAWSGDEPGAIEAFGEAACTETNFDDAVACESICQMLELLDPEEGIEVSRTLFRVKSVSKLLTNWQETPRIVRGETAPEEKHAAKLQLIDRAQVPQEELEGMSVGDVPNVIGEITVVDADEASGSPAQVLFEYYGKAKLDSQISLLSEAAQGELELDGKSEVVATMPTEIHDLHHNWYVASETPLHTVHRLSRERWEWILADVWPNLPLAALDGKTPLETVGDEESKIELTAAINSLEAICDQQEYFFDAQPVRERLQVPESTPLVIGEETVLSTLTLAELRRLPISELSDTQLTHVLRRAIVTKQCSLSYNVFTEILTRPELLSEADTSAVYSELVGLARTKFNREEALDWIDKGRNFDRNRNESIETLAMWDLREATVRLWDPEDSQGPQILKRLWEETSVKLPYLKNVLQTLVETTKIQPPWEGGIIQSPDGSGSAGGEVWTPGAQPGEEKSKLWIPGQD